MLCRADAVTDLDEGAAPSESTQGPAEGQSEAAPDGQSGAAPEGAEGKEAEDPSAFLQQEGEAADVYARRIFERVYGHDIERVLRMEVRLHASAAFNIFLWTHLVVKSQDMAVRVVSEAALEMVILRCLCI